MPRQKIDPKNRPLEGPLGTIDPSEWADWAAAWRGMNRNDREAFKKSSPSQYEVAYFADLRERALESFWVFESEVLQNPVLYEPLHREICDWLQPDAWDKQKKMLLMARGHVKSNVITVGWTLWKLCRNKNERILVASHRDEDATKFISAIGNIVTNHDRFKAVFPDIRPAMGNNAKFRKWSEWRILIERDTDYIEPSVHGTTPRKSASGQHYSIFIPDDIVTHLNVESEVQLEKTEAFHKQGESLLDPGALELMVGTRYHFDDEYGRILDTADLRDLYDVKVIPATKDPLIVDEYISGRKKWQSRDEDFAHLAYPSRYTLAPRDYIHPDDETKNRKSLPAIKKMQGALVYANQYQLEPRDPSEQCFDLENIPIVDELPAGRLDWYQVLDHASEKRTQSCTALVTIAIGPRFECYIVDVFWGTFSNAQVSEEIFRWQQMDDDIRPRMVGSERGPYELQLESYVRERSKELGISVPWQFITGAQHHQEKDDHIRGLTPFVEARKIRVLESCRNRQQLLREFDLFPKSKSKDCIDATAQIVKIALPGRERDFLQQAPAPEKPKSKGGVTMDEALAELESSGKVRIGSHQVMGRGARSALHTGKVRMR